MICSVEGCERAVVARGWCRKHYGRWHKTGSISDPVKLERTCSVKGCDNKYRGRGFCHRHWTRLYNGFNPHVPTRFDLTTEERFWSKVRLDQATGCWLWTAGRTDCGYGTFHADGKALIAHRFAYELLVAEIPPGLHIDHLCRNRACVNALEHLEPVTLAENNRRAAEQKAWLTGSGNDAA